MKKRLKKIIAPIVSIILVFSSLLSITSCDVINGIIDEGGRKDELQGELFNGKGPSDLYADAVYKYDLSRNQGAPCSIYAVLTVDNQKESITFDIAYDGGNLAYKITLSDGVATTNQEIIYHSDKMYFKDEQDGKHSYSTERYDVMSYAENSTTGSYVAAALPNELPDSWFEDIDFIPTDDGEYIVTIDIDETKSKEYKHHSKIYRPGSKIKLYFNEEGILDRTELEDVNIDGTISNLIIEFSWQLSENIVEPSDKDNYVHKGKFEFDKGHIPGGDYREDKDNTEEDNTEDGSTEGGSTEDNTSGGDGYDWVGGVASIALYENDNMGELSSGLKRYYAGKDDSVNEEIDVLVRERNKTAEDRGYYATYTYRNEFALGESFSDIQRLVSSGDSSAPDVYCNFAYDLTSLALRGCFANLLNPHTDCFSFVKEDYVYEAEDDFDTTAGQGYLYEYMQSLAFANQNGEYDKMYCLASNYTLDVFRSFVVMPVNVNMMNSIALDNSTGDMDEDGDFDIYDFYAVVWGGGWTYDVLAQYCNAVYDDNGDNPGVSDINDTLGAAFGRTSGLTSAGLLYSSSVNIIQKVEEKGQVTYTYPEENKELLDFAEALEKLFSPEKSIYGANGIISVSNSEVNMAGLGNSTSQSDLVGIRQQFAKNKMLFGGIILLGHFEERAYQDMNDNSLGFGIVPVPVYSEGDEYRVQVHNVARVAAISKKTFQLTYCMSYLDYMSTHSDEILDAYYDQELVARTANGISAEQNKKMLTYIKNHVSGCFDKTYEDIITDYLLRYSDKDAWNKRWHIILQSNKFIYSGLGADYASFREGKNAYLVRNDNGYFKSVLNIWYELSNNE